MCSVTTASVCDHVEQLTFLLFLKMADEQSRPPFRRESPVPKGFGLGCARHPRWRRPGDSLPAHPGRAWPPGKSPRTSKPLWRSSSGIVDDLER